MDLAQRFRKDQGVIPRQSPGDSGCGLEYRVQHEESHNDADNLGSHSAGVRVKGDSVEFEWQVTAIHYQSPVLFTKEESHPLMARIRSKSAILYSSAIAKTKAVTNPIPMALTLAMGTEERGSGASSAI